MKPNRQSDWLLMDERDVVLECELRHEMFIGGFVDHPRRRLVLLTGYLQVVIASFDSFRPSGDGTLPDFSRFSITDFGHTVRLGEYESSSEIIILEETHETP